MLIWSRPGVLKLVGAPPGGGGAYASTTGVCGRYELSKIANKMNKKGRASINENHSLN